MSVGDVCGRVFARFHGEWACTKLALMPLQTSFILTCLQLSVNEENTMNHSFYTKKCFPNSDKKNYVLFSKKKLTKKLIHLPMLLTSPILPNTLILLIILLWLLYSNSTITKKKLKQLYLTTKYAETLQLLVTLYTYNFKSLEWQCQEKSCVSKVTSLLKPLW